MLYPKPAHLSNRPIQDFDSSCSDTEIEESSGQASDGIRGDGSDGGSGLASAVPTGGSLDSGESDGRMVSISDDEDDHDRDSMDPTLNFILKYLIHNLFLKSHQFHLTLWNLLSMNQFRMMSWDLQLQNPLNPSVSMTSTDLRTKPFLLKGYPSRHQRNARTRRKRSKS